MSNMKRLDLEIQEGNQVNFLPTSYLYDNETLTVSENPTEFVFTQAVKIVSYNFSPNRIELDVVEAPFGKEGKRTRRNCVIHSTYADRSYMSREDGEALKKAIANAHLEYRQPVRLLKVKSAKTEYFCGIRALVSGLCYGIEEASTQSQTNGYGYWSKKSDSILD